MLEFLMEKLPPGCEDYRIEVGPDNPHGLRAMVGCDRCGSEFNASSFYVDDISDDILLYITSHNRLCPKRRD